MRYLAACCLYMPLQNTFLPGVGMDSHQRLVGRFLSNNDTCFDHGISQLLLESPLMLTSLKQNNRIDTGYRYRLQNGNLPLVELHSETRSADAISHSPVAPPQKASRRLLDAPRVVRTSRIKSREVIRVALLRHSIKQSLGVLCQACFN